MLNLWIHAAKFYFSFTLVLVGGKEAEKVGFSDLIGRLLCLNWSNLFNCPGMFKFPFMQFKEKRERFQNRPLS